MSLWTRIERRLQDLAGEILPDDFRAALDAARGELLAGRAAEAAEALALMAADRPDHAGVHALLGEAQLELGQIEPAMAAFSRAAELAGDQPEPYLGLGEARLRSGDGAGAVAEFRQAHRRAAGDRAVLAAAYRGMGLGHRMAGDLDRATRELRKAVAEAPDEAGALAALGDLLLGGGEAARGEARRHLRRAVEQPAPPLLSYLALGRLELAAEDAAAARGWFERAVEEARRRGGSPVPPDDRGALADALAGLADADLQLGELDAARARLEEARQQAPERIDLGARLGDVLAARGQHAEALARYQEALDRGAGPAVLSRALGAALAADDLTAAVRLAGLVLEADPGEPRALVARGRALVRAGQLDEAEEVFRTALERDEGCQASLSLAELELAREPSPGRAARAAAWALRALGASPDDGRARAALAEARRRELEVRRARIAPGEPSALYELAEEARRLCVARPELADLGGDAARAGGSFDEPLLVTVMGEFSSGKSTFINAFIGEDVAPTGITPTTATINVVKYGRERGGRIVHRDGHTEDLGWAELFERLRGLDADAARSISMVEIMVPQESLTRVHLVDTPGLNSILPEHEEVARAFIARADAVVWLFSAQQAGKSSERAALRTLADEGVRVLGVLNKVDQLEERERDAARRYVAGELEGLVELVVPLSARRAVESAGEDPAWQELSRVLEERFFARARDIKRQVLARRLDRVLAEATRRTGEARAAAGESAGRRRRAAESSRAARDGFLVGAVTRERRRLGEGAAGLYRDAAQEVLELVIPRRLPFGSHRASRADRDYLVSLLDGGFAALLEQSRRRVDADLRKAGAEAIGIAAEGGPDAALGEVERALSDAIHILDAQAYARTLAYLRGYLEGGTVDNFFRRDLPRIDLEEDAVYHALYRDSPDLDAAVAVPLAEAGLAALDRVTGALDRLADAAAVRALDLEVGVCRALDELRGLLAEVTR